ncbi:glycosyl transferase family protein [Sphingomonas sanguinis]|uniref:Glycosyl transferase family protein n=1 Tax=Sphingomonas sanguinis TaxID=33051 RepID=A0ABU5LRF0_9SPHN|nr:glycosyl transferase family protein [Sphingomonas sanguinis]MDZ7282513.1 glycosyl transferase family protein [Sphingomonas sanguinis]QXT34579.1 glycosyl transferase family protein [Sphingomonas sanguinis]
MGGIIEAVDVIARELLLFAGAGLLIGGLDDLLVDLLYLARRAGAGRKGRMHLHHLSAPVTTGRMIVFIPAWDEAEVIGAMLSTALARFRHDDYRLYVGLYPNDPASIAAAADVAETDARVRLVVGGRAGPTTKADCLNTLWHALARDRAAEGFSVKAIVLHDSEDVVHPAELSVFDSLIEGRAVVQLPVLPLVVPGSRLVSGHYADEFAESHRKQLIVRTWIGAGMPLAGTGCAIAPAMLAEIAARRGGDPFDATSLTEDYELGLRIAELGGEGLFARVTDETGGVVAVRAFFPADLVAAVRQKARWMTGIALIGWDRTGWGKPLALGDHWWRLRDRRGPLAMLVLAAAYLGLFADAAAIALHEIEATPLPALDPGLGWLFAVNTLLLGWRLSVRMVFTGRTYGTRESLWSLPRFVVGNFVALAAAPRAMMRYLLILRGRPVVWDKTRHVFPDVSAQP